MRVNTVNIRNRKAPKLRKYYHRSLGQFTSNYTQTVKRAADNKRRYAPGWVHTPMDEETADLFKQLAKKMMKGIE